jgi:hypothetical protein
MRGPERCWHIIDEHLLSASAQDGFGAAQGNPTAAIALKFISTITVGLIRRVWYGLMVVVIANGMGVAQTLESRANRRR